MENPLLPENPLVTRYASRAMAELWSPQQKFSTWRRLWVALAEAEYELGMTTADGTTPRIRPEQIAELKAHLDDIDFDLAAKNETRLRHDVMAHIHTYAERCPGARDIIHLGATSCFVTDNTDLLLLRSGLKLLRDRLVGVLDALASFAWRWRHLPTLGYTHYQPAQLTTVGKRATLWCYDFLLDLEELDHRLGTLRFRGAKGTTGTQASFLSLFHGDHEKVRKLDQLVAQKMGFPVTYPVTGQTYPRKVDSQILDTLSGLGQTAHKWGMDLRLLAHDREIEEPQEKEQVGSSAMAYKRNPMRAERMCGLSRYLSTLTVSAAQTAATQWLERTLDDSVNRRLTLPHAFLTADAVLNVALNLANRLIVNEEVIRFHVAEVYPYMATENILMAAVARGGDRQQLHEAIRQHSHAVTEARKKGAPGNDLLARLAEDPAFAALALTEKEMRQVADENALTGRAPQQVEEFIADYIDPVRSRYRELGGQTTELRV